MELPANYVSVQEILNLEKRRQGQVPKEIKAWSFVNFIGVIVDRREPKPTSREGTLFPSSSQHCITHAIIFRLESRYQGRRYLYR